MHTSYLLISLSSFSALAYAAVPPPPAPSAETQPTAPAPPMQQAPHNDIYTPSAASPAMNPSVNPSANPSANPSGSAPMRNPPGTLPAGSSNPANNGASKSLLLPEAEPTNTRIMSPEPQFTANSNMNMNQGSNTDRRGGGGYTNTNDNKNGYGYAQQQQQGPERLPETIPQGNPSTSSTTQHQREEMPYTNATKMGVLPGGIRGGPPKFYKSMASDPGYIEGQCIPQVQIEGRGKLNMCVMNETYAKQHPENEFVDCPCRNQRDRCATQESKCFFNKRGKGCHCCGKDSRGMDTCIVIDERVKLCPNGKCAPHIPTYDANSSYRRPELEGTPTAARKGLYKDTVPRIPTDRNNPPINAGTDAEGFPLRPTRSVEGTVPSMPAGEKYRTSRTASPAGAEDSTPTPGQRGFYGPRDRKNGNEHSVNRLGRWSWPNG